MDTPIQSVTEADTRYHEAAGSQNSKATITQGQEKKGTFDVTLKSSVHDSQTSNLPKKNLWFTISTFMRVIARSLGFTLIFHAFQTSWHPVGRGLHEPIKIAIDHNRRIALFRGLIHLVPVGIAICEIFLNWYTFYVGTKAYSPAIYQFMAKVHEIMIQASIAALIVSCVRSELALGEGIPFGLLFSGLQVSQISYLWSVEFWGSLSVGDGRRFRKFGLLTIVVLGIILATACGPSSAVLLIPRLEYWPAGRTHIWINATHDQIWPTYLDDSSISESCSTILQDAPSGACPSSEWGVLREYLSLTKQVLPQSYINTYDYAESPTCLILNGKSSTRLLQIGEDESFIGQGPRPRIVTAPHAVVADALTTTGALWFLSLTNVTAKASHGSPFSDQSDALHTIAGNYSQPYGTAVCVPDSIHNISDSRKLVLPFLPNANPESLMSRNLTYKGFFGEHTAPTIEHPIVTYGQVSDAPGSATDYRLKWIELPQDAFSGSSIGAVILLPYHEKNASQDILTCNLSAGWGPAAIQLDTFDGGTSVISSKMIETFDGTGGIPISQTHEPAAEGMPGTNNWFEYHYPDFPRQLINITQSWAEYLNPSIPSQNTSVINLLMQQEIFPRQQYVSASTALASLVVNGLARTSFESQLQGDVKTIGPQGNNGLDGNYWLSGKGDVFNVDPIQSRNWVTLRVDSTLQGYAYNTRSVPPRIAIAFLTAYCILALLHLLYYGFTGISSTCWDSIAEVTALAMNSTPTAALRNTCAGITELHIFRLPVRVLVSKDQEGEGEHLELVFGNVDQELIENTTLKANRAYGTMPSSASQRRKTCSPEGVVEYHSIDI